MNKEQLLALGLSEEQAEKVVKGIEESGSVPYARFKEVNDAKKALESQVSDFSEQLKKLQGAVKGNEELESTIKELQEAQSKLKVEYEQQLKENARMTELRLELIKSNEFHDVDLVIGLLDKESIQFDENNKITGGLDDQKNALKESKPFLAIQQEQQKPTLSGIKPNNVEAPPVASVSFGAQLAQQRNQQQQNKPKIDPWGQVGGTL